MRSRETKAASEVLMDLSGDYHAVFCIPLFIDRGLDCARWSVLRPFARSLVHKSLRKLSCYNDTSKLIVST